MGWKAFIISIIILLFLVNIAFSQPFGPPLFIANPNTLECKYYFSGNPEHFNPRPENYTENIGYTTEFESQDQACNLYRCIKTSGKVLLTNKDDPNPKLCGCPISTTWNNETGCTISSNPMTGLTTREQTIENVFIRFWKWIVTLFK